MVASDLAALLGTPGPCATAEEPEAGSPDDLAEHEILVVGAGGLGCEILKDLVLTGFRKITIIDMDTIDITNLNRQFLFRMSDVGKYKAQAAVEFVQKRLSHLKLTELKYYTCKIQDIEATEPGFYQKFAAVVAGLDNVDARRWLNNKLHSFLEFNAEGEVDLEESMMIPLLDGGTEGLKGQARVIQPGLTPCFECTLGMFPPQRTFPLCTIASVPRQPDHCISWASELQWKKERPDEAIDNDNPEHIQWICDQAQKRAAEFGIQGVDYQLTLGVVKNIIPAVASTNALISASLVQELLKLVTVYAAPFGRPDGDFSTTYQLYNGEDGATIAMQELQKLDGCLVCRGMATIERSVGRGTKLEDFLQDLATHRTQPLKKPSLSCNSSTLWLTDKKGVPMSHVAENARMTWDELIAAGKFKEGEMIEVFDKATLGDKRLVLRLTLTEA